MSTESLPSHVTAFLVAARAAHVKKDARKVDASIRAALDAVAFPKTFPDVVYPLVEDLTPTQRALAEVLAREDLQSPWERLPSRETSRRWLGLDPPGPLEALIDHGGRRVLVWHALRTADHRATAALVAKLPPAHQLDVLACLGGPAWAYRIDPDEDVVWAIASKLDSAGRNSAGRAWALARLRGGRGADAHEEEALEKQLAFFVLVRAGHAIDPAWDAFLPIGTSVPPAIAAECARAVPLDRLERVAIAMLEKAFGPKAIQIGLAILAHHDSPAVARFVWTKSERSFPHHKDAERRALIAIAEKHPGAREALVSLRGKVPRARRLAVSARLAPRSEADLTKLQCAQLVEAGRRWDRKDLPVARRLSVDENDSAAIGAVLEHLSIAENGKPTFEAWLYQGDSGTFFTAGTTKVIARRIQGAVELAGKQDTALADALGRLDVSKAAERPLAEVRAATQAGLAAKQTAPTRRTPAKKTPAKKTPAKKTPAKKKT